MPLQIFYAIQAAPHSLTWRETFSSSPIFSAAAKILAKPSNTTLKIVLSSLASSKVHSLEGWHRTGTAKQSARHCLFVTTNLLSIWMFQRCIPHPPPSVGLGRAKKLKIEMVKWKKKKTGIVYCCRAAASCSQLMGKLLTDGAASAEFHRETRQRRGNLLPISWRV